VNRKPYFRVGKPLDPSHPIYSTGNIIGSLANTIPRVRQPKAEAGVDYTTRLPITERGTRVDNIETPDDQSW
jgi:hypothetical protein